ncbi:hypothetical protein VKT23_009334 [Stygiomarasmius scandens]|uniref:Uncharacterized protein n=1 Tax=Marasmiellus scandens TaxID=2682957 RepID=A0ABR1JF29_9AGAR
MFSSLVLTAPLALAALASACKPQFPEGVYSILYSDDPSYGWRYKWPGPGQVSPAVELVQIQDFNAPNTTWYIWPPNGTSPDWTVSTAQFDRYTTCVVAPNAQLPAPMTNDRCHPADSEYAVDKAVFSIDCDTCLEDTAGGHGCVLTMPYIGAVCPSYPPTNTDLVTLTKCGFSTSAKWDIQLAP